MRNIFFICFTIIFSPCTFRVSACTLFLPLVFKVRINTRSNHETSDTNEKNRRESNITDTVVRCAISDDVSLSFSALISPTFSPILSKHWDESSSLHHWRQYRLPQFAHFTLKTSSPILFTILSLYHLNIHLFL